MACRKSTDLVSSQTDIFHTAVLGCLGSCSLLTTRRMVGTDRIRRSTCFASSRNRIAEVYREAGRRTRAASDAARLCSRRLAAASRSSFTSSTRASSRVVATTRSGSSVEVALVGREGVAGLGRRARHAAAAVRPGGAAAGPRLSRAEAADPRAHPVVQRPARAPDGLLAAGDAPARAVGVVQPFSHLGAAAGAVAAAHRRARRHQPLRADARVRRRRWSARRDRR